MSAPSTPLEVVRRLSDLTEQLRSQTRAYGLAEQDAAQKRHAADMAESRAFLSATGAMELRKHEARVAADQNENDAKVAEALVKVLRSRIRVIETEIEVGRTYGVTLRAEMKAMPYGGDGA